jgi:hypothetical protein
MTPPEVLASARIAGLTVRLLDSGKIRIEGFTAAEPRDKWAALAEPVKEELIALVRAEAPGTCSAGTSAPPACTMGRSSTAGCPEHGWIHGDLPAQDQCHECGRADWRIALTDDAGRVCLDCIRRRRAPAASSGRREREGAA